jgi:hypothetical protein
MTSNLIHSSVAGCSSNNLAAYIYQDSENTSPTGTIYSIQSIITTSTITTFTNSSSADKTSHRTTRRERLSSTDSSDRLSHSSSSLEMVEAEPIDMNSSRMQTRSLTRKTRLLSDNNSDQVSKRQKKEFLIIKIPMSIVRKALGEQIPNFNNLEKPKEPFIAVECEEGTLLSSEMLILMPESSKTLSKEPEQINMNQVAEGIEKTVTSITINLDDEDSKEEFSLDL